MIPVEPVIRPGLSQVVSQLPPKPPNRGLEELLARARPAAAVSPSDQASSNLAMTSVSASPSRVHSWNAGNAIMVSM